MAKRIDGQMLAGMLKSGYANLCVEENKINDLNVFPVADGDTGVNMRLTVEHGLKTAQPYMHLGKFLHGFSDGALLGARGNSGVILSQIIKGWAIELENCPVAGIAELRNAFIRGYKQAYASVARPVEGTILTVAREGIMNIRTRINRGTTVESLFAMYLEEMRKTLAKTPDMLDVLKKANVVDSGAVGYIALISGMLKYLMGQTVVKPREQDKPLQKNNENTVDLNSFDEESTFDLGYCTEFILQLLKDEKYRQDFDVDAFIQFLYTVGDSIVCVKDGSRVKTHVHTKTPEKVIEYVRQYGEFLTVHIENMQLQHNEHLKIKLQTVEKVPLAIISVVDGKVLGEVFEELGCKRAIDVGPSMNVSASEFLEAFESTPAEQIVVLPNNKNTVSSANQAKELYKGDSVITVIPTSSMIEGYCAVAMDVADEKDVGKRIKSIENGVKDVHTLEVAIASKDYYDEGVSAVSGQYIAIVDGKIIYASDSQSDAVIKGMENLPDINEKDICLIMNGEGTEDTVSDIEEAVAESFSGLDVNVIYGGQKHYLYMIGLM